MAQLDSENRTRNNSIIKKDGEAECITIIEIDKNTNAKRYLRGNKISRKKYVFKKEKD